MTWVPSPDAGALIADDHERLHLAIDLISAMAEDLEEGKSVPRLHSALVNLAMLFREHQVRETKLLTEALLTGHVWDRERLKATLASHVHEHDVLQNAVDEAAARPANSPEQAIIIIAALQSLELHMEREEKEGFFAERW